MDRGNDEGRGGGSMRLRNHPKMTWHGSPSWPPQWGGFCRPGQKFASGEVGVVKDVQLREAFGSQPKHLTIEIEYEEGGHKGDILLDDLSLLEPLHQRLRDCIGRSTGEIGNLDIDL